MVAATRRPPTPALPRAEYAWSCPKCGATLGSIRGRNLTLPNGDRYDGCTRVTRRCVCGCLIRRTLIAHTRATD